MLTPRIQQHFVEGADLHYQCAQALAPALEAAAMTLVQCLTAGGKVLIAGHGAAAALAPLLAAQLVGRFERERPELPAVAVGAPLAPAAVAASPEAAAWFTTRQLRALGLPGDVLVWLSAAAPGEEAVAWVQAAHERDMTVVAFTSARAGDVPDALRDGDVWVAVPAERPARVLEAQLAALHALCDALDAQLLGEEEMEVTG
ncbi:Phosphoheptose isomerase [Tepidimonas alkaliphilus]|uniref:Phosphoheptose isomerase n=1 Tax=Tepidimonas alkaliphilus TaxID=2588942 RepID=A0A554WBJ6_9BURK|nr:SIS domain-containing protein [Tepidimonas alkaliphilus]TSE20943.1 Phosphoheptose isomerase [Tepidimonas alkaliphilus]